MHLAPNADPFFLAHDRLPHNCFECPHTILQDRIQTLRPSKPSFQAFHFFTLLLLYENAEYYTNVLKIIRYSYLFTSFLLK